MEFYKQLIEFYNNLIDQYKPDFNGMQNQDQNAAGGQLPGDDTKFVNYKELGGKFKCKNDMWTFLAVECGYYLPEKNQCTVYFLGDLMAGRKQRK